MTQSQQILQHLRKSPLTPLEALSLYGCFRLGARVHELRREGHRIESRMVQSNGKHYAEYRLAC